MILSSSSTRRLAAALALTLAAGASAARPAHAWWSEPEPVWAQGRAVDVQVLVDGRPSALYPSPRGDRRRYLQAFAGRNYSLVLRNTTGERLGVLVAVDGLNVVNGTASHLQPGEPMYVLAPYESATIDGWRTSLDDIQRFVFVDEARSYAVRTGQANGDMGWIRVLAFHERRACLPMLGTLVPERTRREDDSRARDEMGSSGQMQAAPPACAPVPSGGGNAPGPQENHLKAEAMEPRSDALAKAFPGTGWGEHRNDHVEQVEFTAERRATDTLVFRYEYASGLRALGIEPAHDRLRDRDNGELGFAKPPRW